MANSQIDRSDLIQTNEQLTKNVGTHEKHPDLKRKVRQWIVFLYVGSIFFAIHFIYLKHMASLGVEIAFIYKLPSLFLTAFLVFAMRDSDRIKLLLGIFVFSVGLLGTDLMIRTFFMV